MGTHPGKITGSVQEISSFRGLGVEIRFGEWAVDHDRRLVLRQGTAVHLSPKAFELLEILVEARPRVLTKTELLERLWPQTYVVEANLSNLVAEIRAALGDSSRKPRWVRTAHGLGYSFEAEVTSEAPEAVGFYWLIHPEGRVALREGNHLIGRHPRSVVPIDSSTVSRTHARIVISGGEAVLRDLGSKNGTYLRGVRIREPAVLHDGDDIAIGEVVLTFRVPALRDPTEELARFR